MQARDRNVFGSHEIAYECLADLERTANFERAIDAVVGPSSRVLELGTGTGILALMAARSGASKVDAYEIEGPMALIARANVAANEMSEVITVIEGDVTTDLEAGSGPYDVVIAEMISVGLIEEQLVPALNAAIQSGDLTPGVVSVPAANMTWIELVETDFSFFGFSMPTIQVEQTWQPSKLREKRSEPIEVERTELTKALRSRRPIDCAVHRQVSIVPTNGGDINSARLTSVSILSPGVSSGWTQCMNSPAVIPIEGRRLERGVAVQAIVSYTMGEEMSSFTFEWT